MKGKLISMMKRWWLVVFVFTLALTLTSCSRKRASNLQDAVALPCQGELGDFDVWVIRSTSQTGMYQLVVIPVALTVPGDIATITVVASSNGAYRQMVPQVVLDNESEIPVGFLTEYELNLYDQLSISLYDGANDFTQSQAEFTNCEIPYPDGTNTPVQ